MAAGARSGVLTGTALRHCACHFESRTVCGVFLKVKMGKREAPSLYAEKS